MREYAIEYSDQDLLAKILGICIVLFLLVQISVFFFVTEELMLALGIMVGFVLPIIYFFANKWKIKKTGVILIGDGRIAFGVAGNTKIIRIPDLAKYQVSHGHSTALTLVTKDGKTFRLVANSNFCDSSKFEQACQDIEEIIREFISANQEGKSQSG